MEPEGSILCPHAPATRSCPEPDQCSPRKPILFEINFNIILQSTLRPSKWSLSFRFPYQNSVCTSVIPLTCQQHRQSHCYLITLIIFVQDVICKYKIINWRDMWENWEDTLDVRCQFSRTWDVCSWCNVGLYCKKQKTKKKVGAGSERLISEGEYMLFCNVEIIESDFTDGLKWYSCSQIWVKHIAM